MMTITDDELEAFLDEALAADVMARIEQTLRGNAELLARLTAVNGRRNAGLYSIGAIWREHRLSCPSRQELQNYLRGKLEESHADYIAFHLKTSGCRVCQANLGDLRAQPTEATANLDSRRRRYFQSSANRLPSR
jgi:DNA repair photolyase